MSMSKKERLFLILQLQLKDPAGYEKLSTLSGEDLVAIIEDIVTLKSPGTPNYVPPCDCDYTLEFDIESQAGWEGDGKEDGEGGSHL